MKYKFFTCFCIMIFCALSLYGSSDSKKIKNKALIAFKIGEYDACVSYCKQLPASYLSEDDEISHAWQSSIDTLSTRKLSEIRTLTHIFNFSKALDILKTIHKNYSGYKVVNLMISQYQKYVEEQQKGKIVTAQLTNILEKYDRIDSFHDGWARVGKRTQDGYAYNHISPYGMEIERFSSNSVYTHEFSDGYSLYGIGWPTSITDINGTVYYPWEIGLDKAYDYDGFTDFESGFMRVRKKNGKWGYIGKDKTIIACKYDQAFPFHEGLALVFKGDHCFYIDTNGKKATDNVKLFGNDWDIAYFSEGLVWLREENKDRTYHIAMDKSGNILIRLPYVFEYNEKIGILNTVHPFRNGASRAVMEIWNRDKKKYDYYYGFIDKNGKVLVDFVLEYANDFSEGLSAVKKNGKWGFINNKGEEVIPYTYLSAGSFSEGMAAVKFNNGKYGYIDGSGNVVITPRFDNADNFSEGFAVVRLGGKYGFIDKYGFCTLDYNRQ